MQQDSFDFSKAAPHLQAGSFVQFLVEDFGVEALKKIWKGGLEISQEATGLTAREVEELWLKRISLNEFKKTGNELNSEGKVRCE